MASIFLSHSSEDKGFVRELHKILRGNNIESWIDEAEIKIGDSLIKKISEGIEMADYVAIILSPKSMKSNWVKKELEMAVTKERNNSGKKVLPILIEDCEIPLYLQDKKYGDFRNSSKAISSLMELISILRPMAEDEAKEETKKIMTGKQMKVKPQKGEKNFKEFKEVYDIATRSAVSGGMGLSRGDAFKIAMGRLNDNS